MCNCFVWDKNKLERVSCFEIFQCESCLVGSTVKPSIVGDEKEVTDRVNGSKKIVQLGTMKQSINKDED